MNLVIPFSQRDAGLVSVVGGKGANLIALTAAQLPVPPGFVVTAAAYQQFLDRVDWLEAELGKLDFANPERLRDQCTALRERLAKVELSQPVQDAIHSGLTSLGSEEPVAVRSSSTFEDLAQAAFAGQHDTYLNVRGVHAVVARVRDCFVSLWGDRAVLYRHHQGFQQREARMAVVVQKQIACDRAGVGFSINPVSGRMNQMVIEANYGLGESVVAGECEVDHFELDKATLAIVQKTIGHKEKMIVPSGTEVEERHVAAELADQPSLSHEQLQAVGQLLKRVEAHYGWPQDIEWGWKGEALYLFQSRPVTTFQPSWTRDESAERFPNPITPLSWDFIHSAFIRSLPHSLNLMGLPPLQGDWFQRFNHYVYGNQNAVELIASHRPLKARNAAELAAEIPELRKKYAWVLDLPVAWARDLDRYLLRLGRLSAAPLDDAGIPALWQHMLDALSTATDYFQPNIAISMTQAFLHRLLHALVRMVVGPERALEVVDGLLAGCETKTAVVNRELHELAQVAAQTLALKHALVDKGGKALWDSGTIRSYPTFATRLERFLQDHGHREMDMDYAVPTWADQPWIVLEALALILRSDSGEDPAETARKHRQTFAATEHEFLGGLPEDLRFFFRELIRMARTYTALDDMEHYQTTRINLVARRAALALGRRLQERGILDAAEDVFFFHKAELEELVAAYPNEPRAAFREKVRQTKESFAAARQGTPAWSLEKTEAPAETGKSLRGLPGSPGRVTGTCFCVREPADFGRFPKGAILVARTTNPAWTPLFYSAAGLITESGGPLSHGAVTAREMRLPAVMSVRGAMGIFKDGQKVTVDGSQGLVMLE